MNVRPFIPADLPILQEIHLRSGYDFPFPQNIENYLVATDELGCPIMAAGERLIPEITLICAPGGTTHPLLKFKGIALIHDALRDRLLQKGFSEAICSVPPELERNYSRHLQRHFHWKESWKTFRIQDWRG